MSSVSAGVSFVETALGRVSSLLGIARDDAKELVRDAMDALGIDPGESQEADQSGVGGGDTLGFSGRMEAVLEIAVSAYFSRSEHVEEAGRSIGKSSNSRGDREKGLKSKRFVANDDGKGKPVGSQTTLGSFFGASSSIKTQRTISSMFSGRKRDSSSIESVGEKIEQVSDDSTKGRQERSSEQKRRVVHSHNDNSLHLSERSAGGSDCATAETSVHEKKRNASEINVKEDADDVIFVDGNMCEEKVSNEDMNKLQGSGVRTGSCVSSPEKEFDPDFLSNDFDALRLARFYHGSKETSPPFLHLAKALAQVCSTTKRLEKERILTNVLLTFLYYDRFLTESLPNCPMKMPSYGKESESAQVFGRSCVLHAVLISGNVACDGLVLNIGHSAISQAICSALSCSASRLRQQVGNAGELGDAAANILSGKASNSAEGDCGQKQQTRLTWGAKPKQLRIVDVINTIAAIHTMGKGGGGKGIEAKRKECLAKLFSAAQTHDELRFVVKVFCMHIRTGATLITVMRCLSGAVVLHSRQARNADWHEKCELSERGKGVESGPDLTDRTSSDLKVDIAAAQEKLRKAYALHHDLRSCVLAFVEKGCDGLDEIGVPQAGIPVQAMLASPSRGVHEVVAHYFEHLDAIDNRKDQPFFTAEYKYDGQRAQIHCQRYRHGKVVGGSISVQVFSRHLDDMTEKFGVVVNWLKSREWPDHIESFIIDTEICAVKRVDTGDVVILPFQVLSTMRRNSPDSCGLESSPESSGVCIYVFDIILFNGESLVHQSLARRRNIMKKELSCFTEGGFFEFAKSIDLTVANDGDCSADMPDAETKVNEFLREAIGPGRCEGLMLKSLHSLYTSHETRERSGGFGGWRKLKKDYLDSLADSIDVVPIGAWRGNGRKSKWFSPFLLAVYNPENGEFQSICRCMSGFSDSFYEEKHKLYSQRIVEEKPDNVSTDEIPSFWFEPAEVWEIRGADLTLSPVHHAAKGLLDGSCDVDFDEPRGVSLRFPRFVRERSDKSVEDATTHHQILSLFTQQAQRQSK